MICARMASPRKFARALAVSVVAGDGDPIAPCGRCRQVLLEHGGGELALDAGHDRDPVRLAALLPGAFDAAELAGRTELG